MGRKAWVTRLLLLAIMLLGAWARFYDLENFPPGLFPDQAANGEDALLILEGDVRPFYPRGNGREGLFFFLQAANLKLFGIGVWPLFFASALVGTLTVPALFFATRPFFGRLSALLAAYFLATSHWHVTLSRTGFRAILVPLFVALFTSFVGYLIREVKRDKVRGRAYLYAALAGVALAAGFYTYIAYRVMAGVVLIMALLILLDDWILELRRHGVVHRRDLPHVMRYWPHVLIAVAAAAVVLAPLLWYFGQHQEAVVGRAGQVSIFSPDLQKQFGGGTLEGTLVYSLRETGLSFFAGSGDLNWRHSVAGYPLLNPVVGILWLLGLAWTIHGTVSAVSEIVRGRELHLGLVYPYLLLILVGMLVPVVATAEGMPHGLRSIGLVVPIFLLAGVAASVMLYWLHRRIQFAWGLTVVAGLAGGLLLLSGLHGVALYFLVARNDPAAHAAYRGDLTVVADYIMSQQGLFDSTQSKPYLVLDEFSLQTVHFLTSVAAHDYVVSDAAHPDEAQHRWQQVDPAQSDRTALGPGEIIIFTQSTLPDAERYRQQFASVELVEARTNMFGEEIMRVYRMPAGAPAPAEEEPASLDA